MSASGLGMALAKRLAVAVIVVVLIVAATFALSAATNTPTERQSLETPEYEAETLATTPIPAEGEIEADGSVGKRDGVVVIDDSHSNRISRADLAPLTEELASIGYGVRFYTGDEELEDELRDASAFVVIDPSSEFERDEIRTVREYTRDGGHLLMVGEPDRKRVSASIFGTSVSNQESRLTTLAGRYDMSLGTSYLYNLETNGGNYKYVVARPTPESGLEMERVTMFTAAAVHARSGTVLLRAVDNTHEAGLDGTKRYPVAVYDEDDNAILLGDSSFLTANRFNVGDNEAFAAYLVEFLISGEYEADSGIEPVDDGLNESNESAESTPTTASLAPPRTSDAVATTAGAADRVPLEATVTRATPLGV